MKSLDIKAAVVATVSIIGCVVAYVTRGEIPDALTMVTTASLGGFLGVSIPTR